MIELIYVSRAESRFQEPQLAEMLAVARKNNADKDITGILLYDGQGTFMQALEGDSEDVEPLFEKIKRDDRHSRVNVLWRNKITSRGFPDWKMAFRNIGNISASELNGYSEFLETDSKDDHLLTHKGFALDMLTYFKSKLREPEKS